MIVLFFFSDYQTFAGFKLENTYGVVKSFGNNDLLMHVRFTDAGGKKGRSFPKGNFEWNSALRFKIPSRY